MQTRAKPSGIKLSVEDASIVKGMLKRGDRQHDIAAWFGVNGGRIGEIAAGRVHRSTVVAQASELPPPGPYLSGRDAVVAIKALAAARRAIDQASALLGQ